MARATNVEKLQKAGYSINSSLPKHYADVINGLTTAEVKLLVDTSKLVVNLQNRLDEATVQAAAGGGTKQQGDWTAYMVMPPF